MRRFLILWLCFILAVSALPALASESFSVEAKGAVLIEARSGRILFAQNADEPFPMASTTKIMTCLIALENAGLDEIVTAGPNAVDVEGTAIYLEEGEQLTMEQLLYGLMIRSGNDAAVAIAEHVAGSVEAFAQMMNARAVQLNANATYANPHGLDAPGHRASALGLARIMRECLKNETFRAITATQKKVIPWMGSEYSRVLENKNKLLKTYEGATGGKTGYTSKAGRCLVFSAEREGMELIGVVLNCPTWFDTATEILDYGFENYHLFTPVGEGQMIADAPVQDGQAWAVSALAAKTLSVPVRDGEQYSLRYSLYDDIRAPLAAGQRVGRVWLEIGGEEVTGCDLLAGEDVPRYSLSAALILALRRWALQFADL